jgi:endogenous inhibitor of DNA gyrase (YacG/DUF329 family)
MGEGTKPCPICGEPMQPRYRPFCSKRCADVDLARWFNGAYAIPAEETVGAAPVLTEDGA